MPSPRREPTRAADSLSVKLGNWFEAHATGRGVVVAPIVILIVALCAAAKVLLFKS